MGFIQSISSHGLFLKKSFLELDCSLYNPLCKWIIYYTIDCVNGYLLYNPLCKWIIYYTIDCVNGLFII